MSIGSLGIIGSLAGAPLPQRTAEADKADRETTDQARAHEADERAENAAGIGQAEEDSQASERDADGRRLWETPPQKAPSAEQPAVTESAEHLSKDPCGDRGKQVDLMG